jgi:aldose 1-epimerase
MRHCVAGIVAVAALASGSAQSAPIQTHAVSFGIQSYGTTRDGQKIFQYTLRGRSGAEVRFINYGGIITEIDVPDRDGRKANVALGFGSLADYEAKNKNYAFGAIIGRYAGRIAGARFTVGGKEVKLVANDGPNALHGGAIPGFDSKVWRVALRPRDYAAVLSYTSPDGEQGFPGKLHVKVTYRLLDDNSLRIDYAATTDKPTHINFTNHSYFNLAGAGSGTALDQTLQVPSDRYAEAGDGGIPTGKLLPVAGTPFDFRAPQPLRQCLKIAEKGCNHSWALPSDGKLHLAARVADPKSGRAMEVLTTEPSIHIYTAGYMSGNDTGAQGTPYRAFDAVALEAQHFQDTPHRPEFPTTQLKPGQTYRATTIYRFSAR